MANTARPGGAEAGLGSYMIVGDAIPASLTGNRGTRNAAARSWPTDRWALPPLPQRPFPQERFQGTLAPDLKGRDPR